ncbi:hypothetical protein RCO07_24800 [Escherichia marmotae]|nr:hypothetical protein [Escherichia marmotae]
MATQPTNLPVPSESPRDLKFNAGKIDEYVTSMGWTYTDRFGQKHYTIEGNNYLAQQAMADFGYVILTGKTFTTGATINQPNEVLLNTADGEYYKWTGSFASGPKVVPDNSTPASTGGIGPGAWIGVGDASLRAALALSTGGNLVGLKKTGLPNNLATTVGAHYQTTSINAVTDYGMKPDFDPTTGVANGTNNRAALQQLMDDLVNIGGNKTVIIPSGNYYFNFDGSTNPGGVGVMWERVGAGLKNVTFLCYGASFYSGSVGRLNGIFSANYGVIIKGLRSIGFGGGTLASTRERDQLFAVAYNCYGVTFSECYIANSLGDCIYIGGDLDDGSVTGKFCRDISIVNCTLKERYGNGVRSYNSGSRSRLAVAVIDCVDLIIKDNVIFGEIDLEPNAIGQRLQRIRITKNVFKSGEVQPYTGTNPWYEEPLHSGTQTIRGGVLVQTKAASIIAGNNVIADNDFEYGRIKLTGGSTALQYFYVANNRFSRGLIQVGSTTGSNTNPGIQLVRNFAVAPFNGQDDDIDESGTPTTVPSVMFWVGGLITLGCFIDNICGTSASGFSYMFYSSDTLVAGDNGRNTFAGNYGVSLTSGMFNFTINDTSDEFGNITMPSSGYAYPRITKANVNLLVTNSKPISLTVSGSLDWRNALSKYWDVSPASASLSLTTISNAPVGAEVTIRANSNTPLILAHSTNFYMKGAVNASLSDTRAMITMRQISTGVWTEISRNF